MKQSLPLQGDSHVAARSDGNLKTLLGLLSYFGR